MIFVWLTVILLSVFADQLTKYLVILFLKPDSVPLWKDVLHFTYSENTGMAFGMLGEANQRWVFLVFSTVAILAILGYLIWKRPKDKLLGIALSFVAGGGIGNMIDRVLLGYVVDFIDFTLIDFAIFNVADCFVTIGAGLMMLWAILGMVKESKQQKAEAQAAAEAVEDTAQVENSSEDTTDA